MTKWSYAVVASLLLIAAMSSVFSQEMGLRRHRRMFVVPAPGPVVIDGKLDDWDLSGQIELYVMEGTRATQSGKIAMMYDADALYISGDIRDPSPMMNRHAPEVEGNFCWDADAFQLRLVVDPELGYPVTDNAFVKDVSDQLVHLLLWNYTDRQEANLQMNVSMKYKVPPGSERFGVIQKNRFQAAYRMADDKRGYFFEYRIPWSTLGGKRPLKGGDVVAATMQINWGTPDGLKVVQFSGVAYDLTTAGISYQNAAVWGKLIFSREGHLPHELAEEGVTPAKPQPLTFSYDLPENGEATVALFNKDNEVVRLLDAQTPRQAGHQVVTWDGLDTVGRPVPPGAYTWKGLYHQPITTRHVLSVHNSGNPPYITDDGKGSWGGDHGVPTGICAIANNMILCWSSSEAGYGLLRTDIEGNRQAGARTRAAWFMASDGARLFTSYADGIIVCDAHDFRPLAFGKDVERLAPPPGGTDAVNTITGLAYCNHALYAAFSARNLIAVYDADQGTLTKSWTVPSPGAMTIRQDGTLLLISDGVLATLANGQVAVLARKHLDAPAGLTLDAQGNIYVANRGKLQNVAVFAADGAYQRSIGRAGGRPQLGRYNPAGMLMPKGMAIDAQRRLWVAEESDSPKRISVWDVRSGKLSKEFFGAAHYSSFIWMDPENSREIFCDSVIWKVDLNKKTWYPYSTFWRASDNPDGFGQVATHMGGFRAFTAKNGRQYGWAICGRPGDNPQPTVLFMRVGDIFKPIVAITAAMSSPLIAAKMPAPHGAVFAWEDRNGDMIMQADEISRPVATRWCGLNAVDRELNLWFREPPANIIDSKGDGKYVLFKPLAGAAGSVFHPLRFAKDGRPIYDFTRLEPTSISVNAVDDQDGAAYLCKSLPAPAVDGAYARYSPSGRLEWRYRGVVEWLTAMSLPPMKPGQLYAPTSYLGTAGDITGWNTYFGIAHLYTRDGLYVARLFDDIRIGKGMGPNTIYCENFNGQIVKPKGMERYFFLGGDIDGRVTEVCGLNTVKRLMGGQYTITDADVLTAADALARYQSRRAQTQHVEITHGRKTLGTGVPVEKTVSAERAFRVWLAYDDANLYLQYDVSSPAELVSNESDPRIIFKGGNCCDLQLATDPTADPKRSKPAPGDVRLLVTRRQDAAGKFTPLAVIYRPHIRGFQGQPILLSSPTGKEPFDAIETSDQVKIDYVKTPANFTATLTIPRALLGWTAKSGDAVRLDVGYIFGNSAGNKAAARAYWMNNGFSANILNDIPNESRLEPALWGTAALE